LATSARLKVLAAMINPGLDLESNYKVGRATDKNGQIESFRFGQSRSGDPSENAEANI
jgi:hypothetical protein